MTWAQDALDRVFDAVVVMDQDGIILYWNQTAQNLFGWTMKEAVDQNLGKLLIPEDYRQKHEEGLKRFLETGDAPILNTVVEVEALHKDGSRVPVDLRVSAVPWKGSHIFTGSLRDTTARRQMEQKLEDLQGKLDISACTDSLTGLANRRGMLNKLEYEKHRSDRNGLSFSLIFINIDRFKRINESLGMEIGDQALMAFSRLIEKICRNQDVVGRWEGDAFLILLPDTPLPGATILAEKLKVQVEDHHFSIQEYTVRLTISQGVACRPPREKDIGLSLKRAEEALKEAQEAGGNNIGTRENPIDVD